MGKLTIQTLARSGALAGEGLLRTIGDFNAYYFSGVLFLFSVALVVVVSLLTPRPAEEKVRGLTYGSARSQERAAGTREIVGTCIVAGLVLGMYLYFSFWLD
jgi:SSS family solute:Na+ symporter